MTVHVLGAGVDTFAAGLHVTLRPEALAELEDSIANSRELEEPPRVEIGGIRHQVFRSGGHWSWILVAPDWSLRLAQRAATNPAPTIDVQLRSHFLWGAGAEAAFSRVCELVTPWAAAGPVRKSTVGRVDLALDWCGWQLEPELLERFVRRPRFASATWEPTRNARAVMLRAAELAARLEMRKLGADATRADVAAAAARGALRGLRSSGLGHAFHAANTEATRQQFEARYSWGRTWTGCAWGKGALRARAYRKDVEIRQASGKLWFFDLWAGLGPWEPGEREATLEQLQSTPIWRLEFQLRREALATWRLDTAESVFQARPTLWRQLAGGWLTLREPPPRGGAMNRSRRIVPEWAALRDGWRAEAECPLIRERLRELSLERSRATTFLGLARTIAQLETAPEAASFDLSHALDVFGLEALSELADRGGDWHELVEDYRSRLRRAPYALADGAFSPATI